MSLFPYRMIFIRHGETSYNAEGRLQGQRDIPLAPKGREQATRVGERLLQRFANEIEALDRAEAFYCSPLTRTRQTLELARAAMRLAPDAYRLDPVLQELTFGSWEGLTWPEVEALDPDGARARERDKWNFTPPAGESYAALAERVRPWLAARRGDCFVASHGGVARAFLYLLAGLPPLEAASADIQQGEALIFEDGRYAWTG